MSAWVVDFNDAYRNIRCILCDNRCVVSFRNFVLIFLKSETGDYEESKFVTVMSINV